MAAGIFATAGLVATTIGVPVLEGAAVVVSGYILAATAIDLIDAAVDGKERVAQWAR